MSRSSAEIYEGYYGRAETAKHIPLEVKRGGSSP